MPKTKAIKTSSKKISRLSIGRTKSKTQVQKLPNSFSIFIDSLKLFKVHWRVLGGVTAVYAILSIVLVQSSINIDSLNEEVGSSTFNKATNDFNSLISSFSTGDSLIQFFLFLMVGLAIIWAVRRILIGEKVSTKQAYYQAMTPMVPVLILIILFCIQLLPMLLASAGLQFAFGSDSASTGVEGIAWLVIFILASVWSLFMVARTYIAIFIVTVPAMMPLQSMRKAKELVKGRRFSIIRKLLFLPIAVLIILGVILIPIIIVASVLASPLFLLLGPLSVTFSILYLFVLYQEVIK